MEKMEKASLDLSRKEELSETYQKFSGFVRQVPQRV